MTYARNELACELGRGIMTRWYGKKVADDLFFSSGRLTRNFLKTYDDVGAVLSPIKNLLVGLYSAGEFGHEGG